MKRKAKMSVTRIKRELKALLRSPKCKLTLQQLPTNYATCDWDGDGSVAICIDTPQEERVRYFIHEGLHYVLRDELDARFTKQVEEACVLALEALIYDNDIRPNGRSMAWWKRAVSAKLEQQ